MAVSQVRRAVGPIVRFLHLEAASGAVLAAATVVALLWANSPYGEGYDHFRHVELAGRSVEHWVADGLMAVFFFVVGLEIRREVADGELSDRRTAMLPAVAAIGGMVAPALVYVALNGGGDAARGWAVPTATDIAFAVGVLTLLGRRVPVAARVFLLALAIVDDILAILVIALFYGHGARPVPLLVAAALVVGYGVAARRLPVAPLLLALALAAWWATSESGVHATVAGVALGLATPCGRGHLEALGERLEKRLHPWTVFGVLPLFALVSAGVELSADTLGRAAGDPVAWGVALGLVVGKPVGIGAAALLAVRLGWARLPEGVSWRGVVGVGMVAGIGFTVALFVTTLAFGGSPYADVATLGIFAGSLTAGGLGALVLARGATR